MKKILKRVFLLTLCVIFTLFIACGDDSGNTGRIDLNSTEYQGSSFSTSNVVEVCGVYSAVPKTVEAVISISPTYEGRAGVIFGNYDGKNPCVNFEVHEGGCPRFYYSCNGEVQDVLFSTDVRSETFTHIAFTFSKTEVILYVDGVEKERESLTITEEITALSTPFCIGGDQRSANSQYFKGKIKSVCLYSSVKSPSEIKRDKNGVDLQGDTIMGCYLFNALSSGDVIVDLSKNSLNAKVYSEWLSEGANVTDYDFSFMVIGDTQIVTSEHPDKLKNIYDYVLDNVESKKVKHVFGVGDITDRDATSEWWTATEQISRLDGVVPYSVIRGNHDIYSANKKLSNKSYFDDYFGTDDCFYSDEYVDCYKGDGNAFKARNTVHEFSAGGRDYLVICLDYGADNDILNWASDICYSHPNDNVIISTHAYLASNGGYYDSSKGSPPSRDYGETANNGDEIWEKFVIHHENIVMVVCGHDPTGNIVLRQSEGEMGNIVSEILVDPQGLDASSMGPAGMVATFYVSGDGKTVTVEYYSTVKNKYYKRSNLFSFEVNVIEKE